MSLARLLDHGGCSWWMSTAVRRPQRAVVDSAEEGGRRRRGSGGEVARGRRRRWNLAAVRRPHRVVTSVQGGRRSRGSHGVGAGLQARMADDAAPPQPQVPAPAPSTPTSSEPPSPRSLASPARAPAAHGSFSVWEWCGTGIERLIGFGSDSRLRNILSELSAEYEGTNLLLGCSGPALVLIEKAPYFLRDPPRKGLHLVRLAFTLLCSWLLSSRDWSLESKLVSTSICAS